MPRPPARESLEDKVVRELVAEDEQAVEAIGMQAGPPPGADRLTEADEDEAWETADPAVEYDQMAQLLMTQGLPPEVADRLLLLKLRPDWASLYGRPTQDAELAHQLARVAQFPFRLSLLEDLDPDEMVEKSEQLDRRYQRRAVQRVEQSAMTLPTYGGGG